MEDAIYISGFISFITLILFFVMVANIVTLRKEAQNMRQVIEAWSKSTGIGKKYTCGSCKKGFEGKQEKCPHCGVQNKW